MADNVTECGRRDALHQFLGAKRALARCAPNVDAFGVQDQDVAIDTVQCRAQCVETERVIGGDKDR